MKRSVTACGSVCNGDAEGKGNLARDPQDREKAQSGKGHRGLKSTKIIDKSVIQEEENFAGNAELQVF